MFPATPMLAPLVGLYETTGEPATMRFLESVGSGGGGGLWSRARRTSIRSFVGTNSAGAGLGDASGAGLATGSGDGGTGS